MRKEHTPFYFNKEVDQALKECDEARAEKAQEKWGMENMTKADGKRIIREIMTESRNIQS